MWGRNSNNPYLYVVFPPLWGNKSNKPYLYVLWGNKSNNHCLYVILSSPLVRKWKKPWWGQNRILETEYLPPLWGGVPVDSRPRGQHLIRYEALTVRPQVLAYRQTNCHLQQRWPTSLVVPNSVSNYPRKSLLSDDQIPSAASHGGLYYSGQSGVSFDDWWGGGTVQVYGPCILIVVISWVPFWLNRRYILAFQSLLGS